MGAHKVPISCTSPPVNCPLSPETRETSAFFFLGKFCQHPISLLSSDQLDLTESLFKANNFYSNNVHAFNFLADSSTKIQGIMLNFVCVIFCVSSYTSLT